MSIGILNPGEFVNLDLAYTSIETLYTYMDSIDKDLIKNMIPNTENMEIFKKFREDYKNKLKIDEIRGVNINNLKENIFKKGVFESLDKIQDKIDKYTQALEKMANNLSCIISNDNKNNLVEIKSNDKDGYYLCTTNNRWKDFKKHLEKPDKSKISIS